MENQEEAQMYEQQQYLQTLQSQMDREQINLIQKEHFFAQQQAGLMKEQINLERELELIEHLLRGEIKFIDENNEFSWKVPKGDNQVKVLSELGIQLVINTLNFYLNKNTLLSNYDEETILHKMEDFSESLADALFMSYEKYFIQPTKEECHIEIEKKIKRLVEDEKFYLSIKGIEINEEEIREKIINNMDVKKELEKIREGLQKEKLKGFEHLMRKIQDTVHSAYLRAWNGQERRSLRQHMHISESINPTIKSAGGNSAFKRMFG